MFESIGFVLPPLIDILIKIFKITDKDYKWLFTLLICSLVGFFMNFIEVNGFQGYAGRTLLDIFTSLWSSVAAVWGFSQITYGNPISNWDNSQARTDLKTLL